MPVTRIKNNQITDLAVNAAAKLQDYSITSAKIANNFTYGSDFTITGNLTVQGNVTAIDTTDLIVEDPLILLAKDQTGAPTLDIGFIGERGDELNAAFIWDESEGKFVTALTSDSITNTTITISSYASLQTQDFDAANVAVSGTLDVTGNVTVANINIGADSTIDAGNNRVSNVAEPVANSDVATKAYVDSSSSSGFTIEDDTANTTTVSGGDTLELLGTADEVVVLITDTDQITFGLPANVTIADTLTVTNSANAASFDATGNITGGNLVTAGDVTTATVTASGNIDGGNLVTAGDVTTATVTASGNISAGNVTTTGEVFADSLRTTGNALIGGNLVVQGNLTYINIEDLRIEDPIIVLGTGPNGDPLTTNDGLDRGIYMEYYTTGLGNAFVGWQNTSGNMIIANDVEFSANDVVQVNSYGSLFVGNLFPESIDLQSGNLTAGNLISLGVVDATGNITGGNLVTAGDVSAGTGTVTGNITTGNILTDGYFYANGAPFEPGGTPGGANTNIQFNDDGVFGGDGNLTFDVATGQVDVTGSLVVDNVVIDGDSITSLGSELVINTAGDDVDFRVAGDNEGNLFIVDAGSDTVLIGTGTPTTGAALKIGTTDSFLPPVGNTAQRPGTPVVGMLRFSTTEDKLEVYTTGDGWSPVGSQTFTVISADEFTGDGSTLAFTLSANSTTAGTVVSINGVVQIPTTAYAVSGTTLTFTEAPESTDVIDARIFTTTQEVSVANISNGSGNAVVAVSESAAEVQITGDLIPTANLSFDLGAPTAYWSNLYLAGNTIFLGDLQLKAVSSSEFGVFTSDGVTSANLDLANSAIDTTTVTASGNITGGNILSDGYFFANGDPFGSSYGDANVTTLLGSFGSNAISTTGNISGGNLSGTNIVGTLTTAAQTNITSVGTLSSLSVTGNVTGGNLVTSALVSASDGLFTNDIQVDSLGVGTAASGTTGEIRATNNVTAFYSDRRLKTNIQPLENALDKVCAISGVTFQSNDVAAQHGYTDPKTHVGVIAQEIQAVLPQIVVPAPFDIGVRDDGTEYSVSGENYMTVQYDKLVPLLIEAIKDLKAELDQLKNTKE